MFERQWRTENEVFKIVVAMKTLSKYHEGFQWKCVVYWQSVFEAIWLLPTYQLECNEDVKIQFSVSRLWTRPVELGVNTYEEDQHIYSTERIDEVRHDNSRKYQED